MRIKASKDIDYPVQMKRPEPENTESTREVRLGTRREMEDGGRTKVLRESFTRDAGRLWKQAPMSIKASTTMEATKREIKTYCKTLPI